MSNNQELQNIITRQTGGHMEKMRSQAEILAKYKLGLQEYHELQTDSRDTAREQRLMLYAELKAIGWVLGRTEQLVLKDING